MPSTAPPRRSVGKGAQRLSRSPLQADPTRTATLRRQFLLEVRRRHARVRRKVVDLVLGEDVFGLKARSHNPYVGNVLTLNQRWRFLTDAQKVQQFQQWIQQQLQLEIIGVAAQEIENAYWRKYVEEGYRKGAGRAFDDTRRAAKVVADTQGVSDFYAGTKDEFLRSAFGRPVAIEKVKLLAGRVFTDLKGVTEQTATQMARVLADGLVQGQNPRQIARTLTDRLDKIGLTRAETIARSEIVRAHSEGQLDALEQMGVEEVGVMVEWSTAGDSRVCPLCEAMSGAVFTIKEARGMIPRHANCLPGDSLVLPGGRIAAASKRWFDGDFIVIQTASGRKLSCTPNHPILTDGGWVAAKCVNLGSKVVCDGRSVWESVIDSNNQEIPTSIHNVTESLFRSRQVFAGPVPLTAVDFHGDGMAGQIAIVGTDRSLLLDNDPPSFQGFQHGYFQRGDVGQVALSLGGSKDARRKPTLRSTDGIMSSDNLPLTLSCGHPAPLEGFGFGLVSHGDTTSYQATLDQPTGDAEFIRQLVARLPSEIFLDDVIHIDRFPVSCHVYNLQTENEWYSANGIITHNCRCAHIPANVGEKKKGQKRSQTSIGQARDESIRREVPGKKSLAEKKRDSTWVGADKEFKKDRPKSVLDAPKAKESSDTTKTKAEIIQPKLSPDKPTETKTGPIKFSARPPNIPTYKGAGSETIRAMDKEQLVSYLIDYHGEVPIQFGNQVRDALAEIPEADLKLLAIRGQGVKVGHTVTEVYPELAGATPRGWSTGSSWDQAEGLHYGGNRREACVTAFRRSSGTGELIEARPIASILRHELGHAIDDLDDKLSQTNVSMFWEAYRKDVDELIKSSGSELLSNGFSLRGDASELSYVLQVAKSNVSGMYQASNAGASEAFAEAYASIRGGAVSGEVFDKSFPETIKYVRELVEQQIKDAGL